MNPSASDYFSHCYADAREKFLAATKAAGLRAESHPHPLPGQQGEPLAVDVVRCGATDATRLLVLSSACHGVEGFCGSAVQLALLEDPSFHATAEWAGVAVLYIHALNPHGFSWLRRVTHENVDLNRNFVNYSQALPANPGYDELAQVIVPPQWPPGAEAVAALQAYGQQHGARALQHAISGGQYKHEDGIFYGGRSPTWSHEVLRKILRMHGAHCARLAWIDYHTGLGPSGVGEFILACVDDAVAHERARAWWGSKVTSIFDGSSSSALLHGLMWHCAYQECPQAEYTGVALEFGTVALPEMLDAVRGDQWLKVNPDAGAAQAQAIKARIRDAFYTDTDEWKRAILVQGKVAALQAVKGLASSSQA